MKPEEGFYEIEDEQEVIDFIRNYLPQEVKEKFTDEDLFYLLDLITEYYDTHGDEAAEDDDNYFTVDEEDMKHFIVETAKKEKMGPYLAEDVYFVILGEMEYANSLYEGDQA